MSSYWLVVLLAFHNQDDPVSLLKLNVRVLSGFEHSTNETYNVYLIVCIFFLLWCSVIYPCCHISRKPLRLTLGPLSTTDTERSKCRSVDPRLWDSPGAEEPFLAWRHSPTPFLSIICSFAHVLQIPVFQSLHCVPLGDAQVTASQAPSSSDFHSRETGQLYW